MLEHGILTEHLEYRFLGASAGNDQGGSLSNISLEGIEHAGAFEACRATLLMASEDAGRMAREVAVCAQIAAHRNAWENRRSNTQPMIARETEAAWQLEQITGRLG